MLYEQKRGQNSTIGTTIAIILGVALVVFLIWGFSTNWSIFRSTSGAYTGGTNLDTIVSACRIQYENGFTAQFCSNSKELTLGNGTKATVSCTHPEIANRLASQISNLDLSRCASFPPTS